MILDPEHPAAPIDRIRIGVIGLGGRGRSLLKQLLAIPAGVEVTVLNDPFQKSLDQASGLFIESDLPVPRLLCGEETAWRTVCEDPDIDLILVASPWNLHAAQAVSAMSRGKHVFVEIPAALTIEECWDLVDTSEETGRYCIILENCCFGRSELAVLNMVRAGLLGEITHAECAYIHDLRTVLFDLEGEGRWRRKPHTCVDGNLYPTHGLGPVSTYLDLNRGDCIKRVISMSSPSRSLSLTAANAPVGHPGRAEKFVCGDVNTSLVQTASGKTILMQHDVVSPRPYSRINGLVGTGGSFFGFPDRLVLDRESAHEWISGKELEPYLLHYENRLWVAKNREAEQAGGHGGMDFIMMYHLIDCLRKGRYPDVDVYDAATWSAITPLSIESVKHGCEPHAMPDFTRGRWKTNERIFMPNEPYR
jgi:hypothetical protein